MMHSPTLIPHAPRRTSPWRVVVVALLATWLGLTVAGSVLHASAPLSSTKGTP